MQVLGLQLVCNFAGAPDRNAGLLLGRRVEDGTGGTLGGRGRSGRGDGAGELAANSDDRVDRVAQGDVICGENAGRCAGA